MYCDSCKKSYSPEQKFCTQCGAPLIDELKSNEIQPLHKNDGSRKKTGKIAGMFAVDLIPILGLPSAILWAKSGFKGMKARLAALTAAFLVVNIVMTVLLYGAVLSVMKNRLITAAREENISIGDSRQAAPASSGSAAQTGALEEIPGMMSIPGISDALPSGNGADAGENSTVPNMPDGFTMPGGVNMPDGANMPDGSVIPKADENGNIYFDSNGDGKNDFYIDGEQRIHYDTDGDGQYDTVYEQEFSDGG